MVRLGQVGNLSYVALHRRPHAERGDYHRTDLRSGNRIALLLETAHPMSSPDARDVYQATQLDPIGRIVLLVLLAIPTLGHVFEIRMRGIDPDEFEHLHAAFLVSLGDVPYRDFFEHHGPAWYALLAPLFRIFGPSLDVLWAGRAIALLCGLASIGLTGRLAQRLAGPKVALVSVCLLAWSVVFHVKAIELRPDVPAMLLMLLAASTLWHRDVSFRRAMLAGFWAGLATLFTQKSIVPAAGVWLGWVVASHWQARRCLQPGEWGTSVPRVYRWHEVSQGTLAFALGGALPWLIATALFATAGAADDLWQGTVLQLWHWPLRMSLISKLRSVVAADLPLWFAASWELAGVVIGLLGGNQRRPNAGHLALAMAVTVCLAAIVAVKAVYAQYYLLWIPLLAILAAKRICLWTEGTARPRFVVAVGWLGLLLTVHQAGLIQQALDNAGEGSLPWLWETLASRGAVVHWAVLMLFAAALFAASHGFRQRSVLFVVVLGFLYGSLRNLDAHVWPNTRQIEILQAVNRHVPPDGRVLDGFSGLGALRRHAFYYWWLNDYSKALIGKERLTGLLLPELRQRPPDAILFDGNLRNLPEPITDWIREHYAQTDWDPLWLPKR
jgi:hypothetical protein